MAKKIRAGGQNSTEKLRKLAQFKGKKPAKCESGSRTKGSVAAITVKSTYLKNYKRYFDQTKNR